MSRRQEIDFNVNHPIHDAIFGSDPDGFYNDTPPGAIGENVNQIGIAVQPEGNLPMRGVGDTGGNVEAHQPDSIATHPVTLGAQVDRHRQVQLTHRHTVLVVVAAQSAGDTGDECIVERAAAAVRGLPQR